MERLARISSAAADSILGVFALPLWEELKRSTAASGEAGS
jgi:hypothetical protein